MPKTLKPRRSSRVYISAESMFDTYDNPYKISKDDFRLITKVFFSILSHNMIADGKVYQLPNRLGSIGIYKRPTLGRGIFDYQLYKETGVKVWKKNLHSSQYAASTRWNTKGTKFDSSIPNHIFRLTPCRDHNAKLTSKIRDNNTISKYYDY